MARELHNAKQSRRRVVVIAPNKTAIMLISEAVPIKRPPQIPEHLGKFIIYLHENG